LGNWCDNLGHELLDLSTALSKITVDEFWKSDAGAEFATFIASVAKRAQQASYRFLHASTVYGRDVGHGYAQSLDSAKTEATHLLATFADTTDSQKLQSSLHAITERLETEGQRAAAKLTWYSTNDGLADGSTPLQLSETEDTHFAALADAAVLQALLHGGDPSLIPDAPDIDCATDLKAQLAVIAQDVANHNGDQAFQQDFVNASADSLAILARSLTSTKDGKLLPLDANAQKALSQFAAAVAAATNRDALTPDAFTKLSATSDPWATAMLLQFGPSGAAYGQSQGALLLAKITQNAEHQLQPIDQPDPAWPSGQHPLDAILLRATENGEATRIALGDGTPLAKELARSLLVMHAQYGYPSRGKFYARGSWGRFDNGTADGNAEANFLRAAGIPPMRDDPYSMAAALNVLATASDMHTEHQPRTLVDPVKTVLQGYTAKYADDLAMSSTNDFEREVATSPTQWVSMSRDDVRNILDLAYGKDSDAWRSFRAGILNRAVDNIASGSANRLPDAPLASYQDLAFLDGLANKEGDDWRRAGAMADDQKASNLLMAANTALGAFGNIPLDPAAHPVGAYSQPVAGGVAPLLADIAPDWFDDQHLDRLNDKIREENLDVELSYRILAARALLRSGTLKPELANDLQAHMPQAHGGDPTSFIGWINLHMNDQNYGLDGATLANISESLKEEFDRVQ
ncbi:MAG: hypothetical protein HOW97_36025, partial [Catenulispora sp.]|nr:hypothetical protein [Catenulispora sp.]